MNPLVYWYENQTQKHLCYNVTLTLSGCRVPTNLFPLYSFKKNIYAKSLVTRYFYIQNRSISTLVVGKDQFIKAFNVPLNLSNIPFLLGFHICSIRMLHNEMWHILFDRSWVFTVLRSMRGRGHRQVDYANQEAPLISGRFVMVRNRSWTAREREGVNTALFWWGVSL